MLGERWVLNFAGTNYLGLNQHPNVRRAAARAIEDWGTSLGMPRLFAAVPMAQRLERALARLVGQESAVLFPSTTHLALDVLPLLAGTRGVLFVDEQAYPISLEGAHAAARRGARIVRFPHNDPRELAQLLKAHAPIRDAVIVCDGVYAAGGYPARLRDFARLARAYDAILYVDDAHGLGVLGANPTRGTPYGHGGGGTPRHLGLAPGNIVHVGSLSKAFGAPLAFVAGPSAFLRYLRATAPSYVHSSPPDIPTVAAALSALRVNRSHGEALRRRLLERVRHFRKGLGCAGIRLTPNSLFPIQTLYFASPRAAETTARALRENGIWAILQLRPDDNPGGAALRFVITAGHTHRDINQAVSVISRNMSSLPKRENAILSAYALGGF